MGLATCNDDRCALRAALRGFLQVLWQAAGIACGRFGRRTQPLAQALLGCAEVHLGQRLAAQGSQGRIVSAQARGILLRPPHGDLHHPCDLRQTARILQHGRPIEDHGHQLFLEIHQHELGF